MAVPRLTAVTALIDWNSQIRASKPPKDATADLRAKLALKYIGRVLGRALQQLDAGRRFDVSLRLYYGWRKGFSETDGRRAIGRLMAEDFENLATRSNVIIRHEIRFGDNLISAREGRLHEKMNCHLPNTLRDHIDLPGRLQEKMVDTAIASDLLHLAMTEKERWVIILGEDDDLVPPLLTAEAARGTSEGRIALIRKRKGTPFLKLDGLEFEP
jgi:hypothetical protein